MRYYIVRGTLDAVGIKDRQQGCSSEFFLDTSIQFHFGFILSIWIVLKIQNPLDFKFISNDFLFLECPIYVLCLRFPPANTLVVSALF